MCGKPVIKGVITTKIGRGRGASPANLAAVLAIKTYCHEPITVGLSKRYKGAA
jgi:hypothetical protein